jgi:phosphoribosylformylglycinamidine (FGAM) synthase PurS component
VVVAIQQDRIFRPIEKEKVEEVVVTTAQPNLRQMEMEKVEEVVATTARPNLQLIDKEKSEEEVVTTDLLQNPLIVNIKYY